MVVYAVAFGFITTLLSLPISPHSCLESNSLHSSCGIKVTLSLSDDAFSVEFIFIHIVSFYIGCVNMSTL